MNNEMAGKITSAVKGSCDTIAAVAKELKATSTVKNHKLFSQFKRKNLGTNMVYHSKVLY